MLSVSERAIVHTLGALRRHRAIETCCFWYGPRDDAGNGTVCAVFVPRQRGSWGNYHVTPDAMIDLAHAVGERGWRNLAQVHSHPGVHVEHSRYDDKMASSRRALSLVFPRYGQWHDEWPRGIGIHEHQDGYWHLLELQSAARRIQLAGAEDIEFKDFR